MSKAAEIKEKQELQAKIQRGFNSSTDKVSSWLREDSNSQNTVQSTKIDESKAQFFQLPVIQIGSGLSFENTEDLDNADIHTIGEFIQSDKKVSSLSKKKRSNKELQQKNSIYRIRKDDSGAMVSLKHKIRNQERQKLWNSLPNQNDYKAKIQQDSSNNKTAKNDQLASDEEDGPEFQKHSKKKFGLLFSGKKPKK